ncbi:polymer-forming cytoskeletal protein [Paraclostridium bifermentans]|uniref:polymer-forming cytoskeletal protein n=2 Tax=Paraclostridium bifermentans TaxID=1490 RepID=UPI00115C1C08|nr:polymer-forming cytoskeletal protein [Paraclostridium bifermentans]TQO56388.1 polymer-forming cytoskeletal protein [Paraclostridium bifermentans]
MDSNNKILNINGYSSCGGGEFQEVKISGKGKINNDIKCVKLKISGSANIYGNVNSENVSISGILKVKGNVNALNTHVSGLINVDGGFKGNELNCDGSFTVKNDIECESVVLNGALNNKSFINCENIEINLQGLSDCNEIGAYKVSVYNHNSSKSLLKLFLPKKFKENKLEAKVIEADEIFL